MIFFNWLLMYNFVFHFLQLLNQTIERSIDEESRLSILECIENFTSPEELSGVFACERCRQNSSMQKKMSIVCPPRNLVLHLKRFDVLRNEKLSGHVGFPMYDFKLPHDNDFMIGDLCVPLSDNGKEAIFECCYDLNGLVAHHGTLNQGHYTSYIRMDYNELYFVHKASNFTGLAQNFSEFNEDLLNFVVFSTSGCQLDSHNFRSILNSLFPSTFKNDDDQGNGKRRGGQIVAEKGVLSNIDGMHNFYWIKHDDDCISLVDEDEVRNAPAYMLFYKKID